MSLSGQDSSQPAGAGTSQEVPDQGPATSNSILRVTLLAGEWGSFKDDLSTLNREFAKQLAKVDNVEVTMFVPNCSEEDKTAAKDLGITIVKAEALLGFEPIDWLAFPPRDLSIDIVVGHGIELGRQAQIIKGSHQCRWVQVVHMNPEGEAMHRTCPGSLSTGEERHQVELKLCKRADFVIAVGPKLAEEFTASLRPCNMEVFGLTPGIFGEFDNSKQASEDLTKFRVLVLGQTDLEDFELKGYDIAAEAFAELKDTTYQLIFVGAPKGKEEKVKQYLNEHGISREQLTVRSFCDSREKMADLFCVADLVIMPSRSEGFGLTALEALSAGLPLLVCGNTGFGKALSKVQFGSLYIVDSEVANEWAGAVKKVRQKDRGIRLAEAKTLCTSYAGCYDWQNQCKILVEKWQNMKLGEPESSHDQEGADSQSCIVFQTSRKRKLKTKKDCVTISHEEDGPNWESKRSRKLMTLIAMELLREYDISTVEGLQSYKDQLSGAYRLNVKMVEIKSLKVTVQCCTVEILDNLWRAYESGHLNQIAEKFLITNKILKKMKVSEFKVKTTIDEEEYLKCRQYLQQKLSEDTKEKRLPPSQPPSKKKALYKPYAVDPEESYERPVLKKDTEEKGLLPSLLPLRKKALDKPYAVDPEESYERPVLKKEVGGEPLQAFDLKVKKAHQLDSDTASELGNVLRNTTKIKTLHLSCVKVTELLATTAFKGISVNKSLTAFTLETFQAIPNAIAVDIGKSLSQNAKLTCVTLKLFNILDNSWASVIEQGLSGETPLTSVILDMYGSITDTAASGLTRILSVTSLFSLAVNIHGNTTGPVVTAISEGLSGNTSLRSFSLVVNGELTSGDLVCLENGVVKNKSLTSLTVEVFGKLPPNWGSVRRAILSAKKELGSVELYPEVSGEISPTQVQNLLPFVVKKNLLIRQSLSVDVWGELGFNGAKGLCKVIADASLTNLSVNIHGDVVDYAAASLVQKLKAKEQPPSLAVNIFGELSSTGSTTLKGMSISSQTESSVVTRQDPLTADVEKISIRDSEGTSSSSTVIVIDGDSMSAGKPEDDLLAANPEIVINLHCENQDWRHMLRTHLAKCKPLTTLTLTINNHSDMCREWEEGQLWGLTECESLTALILTISNYSYMSGDWGEDLLCVLGECKSLTTLTLTISNYSYMSGDWGEDLLWNLGGCKSLATLTLTINNYSYTSGDWGEDLLWGLRGCKSLTAVTLTINDHSDMGSDWGRTLLWRLAECPSLATLTLTINNYSDAWQLLVGDFCSGLQNYMSLTTLVLSFDSFSGYNWGNLQHYLAQCKSLATLNLAVKLH